MTGITFVAVFALCYAYLGMVLMPKDINDLGGQKYYATMSYKAEKKNTLDMAFCGNSDVYSGFSPIEFYQQTGTASYVCSAAKQSAKGVEKSIRFLSKHHDLKMVLIDVDCLFAKNTYAGMLAYELTPVIAPFKYHTRWKELESKDLYTLPKLKSDPFKGYIPNKATEKNYKPPVGYMSDVDAAPAKIADSVIRNVKNIVKLCSDYDIRLLFVCLPTPHSWNNAKSNAVANLAGEFGITFIDFNLPRDDYEDYNLDYSTSFRDNGNHMNVKGATYTTNYLANYLNSYGLPDHRNEKKYKDWNDIIPYYEAYMRALEDGKK